MRRKGKARLEQCTERGHCSTITGTVTGTVSTVTVTVTAGRPAGAGAWTRRLPQPQNINLSYSAIQPSTQQ